MFKQNVVEVPDEAEPRRTRTYLIKESKDGLDPAERFIAESGVIR